MSNCKAMTLIPDGICRLKRLKNLDISFSLEVGSVPANFSALESLHFLKLAFRCESDVLPVGLVQRQAPFGLDACGHRRKAWIFQK